MDYTVEDDIYDDGELSIDLTRVKSVENINDYNKYAVYLEGTLYYFLKQDTCKRQDFVKHWREAKSELDHEKLFS